jgi:hypothetical protein
MRQAARIAINRTVAGVHFPADSAAGHLLGITLGEYVVGRCTGSGSGPGFKTFTARRFNGASFANDFDPNENLDSPGSHIEHIGKGAAQGSRLLHWLWKKAKDEFSDNPPQ